MANERWKRRRSLQRLAGGRASPQRPRPLALGVPLSVVAGPLAHGALGVWDEVAVGALLVGCAIAYAIWFYVSGRKAGPGDSE